MKVFTVSCLRVFRIGFLVSGFECQVLSFGFWVLGFEMWVLDSGVLDEQLWSSVMTKSTDLKELIPVRRGRWGEVCII